MRTSIFSRRPNQGIVMRMAMNKRYGLLGVISLALLLLLLMITVACSRGNVQASAPAMPPPLVTVTKATAQDVPRYLDEIGRKPALESVTVTPQVGGRIVERRFRDGEKLATGAHLFVIDP